VRIGVRGDFFRRIAQPGRHFPRAILLAVPIVAVLYILGTSAILAFVPPDSVDLIGPIPQALQIGFAGVTAARVIVPAAILLLLTNYLSSFALNFAATHACRWLLDGPPASGLVHPPGPKFARQSIHSVSRRDYRLCQPHGLDWRARAGSFSNAANLGICVLRVGVSGAFAIPVFAKRDARLRSGITLKIASLCGLALTLLFVVLSIVPIVDVSDRTAYAVKTISVLAGANVWRWCSFTAAAQSRRSDRR